MNCQCGLRGMPQRWRPEWCWQSRWAEEQPQTEDWQTRGSHCDKDRSNEWCPAPNLGMAYTDTAKIKSYLFIYLFFVTTNLTHNRLFSNNDKYFTIDQLSFVFQSWPSFTYSVIILYLFSDHPLPIQWSSFTYSVITLFYYLFFVTTNFTHNRLFSNNDKYFTIDQLSFVFQSWPSFTYSVIILYLFSGHPLPIQWSSFTYSVIILYLFSDHPLPIQWSSFTYSVTTLYLFSDHPLPIQWSSFTYCVTILYLFHGHPLPIPWPSFTYSVTIFYIFRDYPLPNPRTSLPIPWPSFTYSMTLLYRYDLIDF